MQSNTSHHFIVDNVSMIPSVSVIFSQNDTVTADALAAMIEKERSTYRCIDYLHTNRSNYRTMITVDDRRKIVDWCYSVVDHCQFNRETVAIAMEMVDRFLSKPSLIASRALRSHREYQLLAMSALYLAIKLNERVAFGSEYFSMMSNGAYATEEIEEMETTLLQGLAWRVNGPTSRQIAYHFLSLLCLRLGIEIDERTTIAMAAIFNALELKEMEDKERIDLLSELLIVVKHLDIASSDVLFAARTRLTSSIIEGGEADQHTVMDTEDENVDERRKKSRHDQETVVQVNLPTFVATSCCSSSR
ncbi:predicted protein [Thalassiosira pseudonana CCMP1335]|uniref:Cyclin-like domain-containing protein n=1 Tax=Thalassiosira pseudonana TaxID=35128 RepID=B8BW22_THAPS|nr:predicted protein [Thalassiosira pseudonana CCMP1335]EED95560.1 predicted protein [Thalassiosira pseudonana CCMP1335]